MTSASPGWELYRSFLAVLDEGSLSAAARRLGLSQPTLGRHIEQLEAALGGLALFTRSPQGLRPTEAARGIEADVRVMASASEALVRRASADAGEARGAVRITASEVIGAEVLPPMLAAFAEAHPGVAVELVLSNRTEDLLHREADIAVRMVQPAQGALLARKVGVVPLGLYAHRRYAARRGLPTTLDDLGAHRIIGWDRRPSVSPSSISTPLPLKRELFSFRSDSDLANLAAMRAGVGLGACQVPIAARDPDLLPVDRSLFSFELGIWLAMHEDLRNVLRMRLMFDHLFAGLQAYVAGRTP